MAKLSPEERKKRQEAREARENAKAERDERECPGARIAVQTEDYDFLQVCLEAGSGRWLRIRYKGTFWWHQEHFEGKPRADVLTASIYLEPEEVGRFIRALTLRYNAMVKKMNAEVRETPALEVALEFAASEPVC